MDTDWRQNADFVAGCGLLMSGSSKWAQAAEKFDKAAQRLPEADAYGKAECLTLAEYCRSSSFRPLRTPFKKRSDKDFRMLSDDGRDSPPRRSWREGKSKYRLLVPKETDSCS